MSTFPEFEAMANALRCGRSSCRCRKGYVVHCPAHEDTHPSLSLTFNSGKVLWHCQRGCSQGAVLEAFQSRDLWPELRPVEILARREVKAYDYRDADGKLLYQSVRFEPKDFRQRRPDGNGGWMWNLEGVDRVLYRLPELLAASLDDPVFVTDGEKDVDRLLNLGLLATTNSGGAGKWRPEYSETLRGRQVVVLPDNDEPGRAHAREVAASLQGVAASAKVVELPDLPAKGDVSDWIARGGTREQLLARVAAIPEIHSAAPRDGVPAESILRFRTAREIAGETTTAVPWRVPPWVADGAITEVDGKVKSAGKTTWITHMVSAVVTGSSFMGHPVAQSPVVFLTEQPSSSFRVALDRAGLSDREDVFVLYWRDAAGIPWPKVVEAVCQECRRRGARLLVVDTLGQFSGIPGDSENDAGPAQAAMAPLQVAAADGLAVIIARHERKSGGEVGESGRGSSAYAGSVDIVLSLRRAEGAVRPTIREIHSLSRFDETPDRLMIELTENGYVALGTSESVAKHEAEIAILKAAPRDEDGAIKSEILIAAAGIKRAIGYEVVEALYAQQRLNRLGAGKRGDPFRYWTSQTEETLGSQRVDEKSSSETLDLGPAGAPKTDSSRTPRLIVDERIRESSRSGNGELRPDRTPLTDADLPWVQRHPGYEAEDVTG